MKKFKRCLLSAVAMFALANICYANENNDYSAVVDVYGTKSIEVPALKNEFSNEFKTIAAASLSGLTNKKNSYELVEAMNKIENGIKSKNKYAYIHLSSVMYPEELHKAYITIDVVENKDRSRLTVFLPQPTGDFHDPDGLIQSWNTYSNEQLADFFKTKKVTHSGECPVFHCTFGFGGKYKKYLPIFNSKVAKNKQLLINMLSKDKNEEHRATAAFLLGHISDGNELIRILVPSMRDPSSAVRNNVMRVLGATLGKLNTADFPVEEAVAALDFPDETDRNKALYILISLSQQKRYASYIATHAGDLLLTNLHMDQLNLHGCAYAVLTQISGKKFADRDYTAWKEWLDAQKK